jgi:hypothetical protein
MSERLLSEIQEHLVSYLDGRESLVQFEDWFVVAAWDEIDDSRAGQLAGDIEIRLAEFTNDHLPEPELRNEFKALLEGRLSSQPNKLTYLVAGHDYIVVAGTPPSEPRLLHEETLEVRVGR